MRMLRRNQRRNRRGFSLIEVTMAVSIFGVIGYGLFAAVDAGNNSQRAVASMVSRTQSMRAANATLAAELKLGTDSSIDVVVLPDNNHQLTFMHPIELAGALGWGVFDPTLGPTEAEQNRTDWKIRYTVDSVIVGGVTNRRLLRQVLDDTGAIQDTDVLVEGLQDGAAVNPGFSVTRAGDMWAVQVTLAGATGGSNGGGVSFHVKTRN